MLGRKLKCVVYLCRKGTPLVWIWTEALASCRRQRGPDLPVTLDKERERVVVGFALHKN